MSQIRRLRRTDATILPWKNGRGETAQIALWPPHGEFGRGDFDWRLSRAAVVEDGAFSSFPGFDRALVIVEGQGLRLDHGGGEPPAVLRALSPYRFSGDDATTATLIDGPIRDCNLIWRRARVKAVVRVFSDAGREASVDIGGDHAIIHGIAGTIDVTIGDGLESFELAPFETLWIQGGAARGSARIRPRDSAGAWIVARLDEL